MQEHSSTLKVLPLIIASFRSRVRPLKLRNHQVVLFAMSNLNGRVVPENFTLLSSEKLNKRRNWLETLKLGHSWKGKSLIGT